MLSEAEERELAADLEDLAAELRDGLAALRDSARPVDLGEPIGRLSRVDAMQQQSMAQANRQAAEQRQKQVAAAIARIGAGDYGECLDCGEEIAFARLKVRPEAPFCIACQQRREEERGRA